MIKYIVILALFLVYAGCGSDSKEKQSVVEKNLITTPYTITEDIHKRDIKRSVTVLLYAKPSKEELKKIALKIFKSDSASYARTFISYYLNDNSKDYGYWATTHFNPSLEVKILGLSDEGEKSLLYNNNPDRKILGAYIDPISGAKRTFFIKNNKMFMELYFDDGSNGIQEMKYKKINNDFRIEEKGKNGSGEYFILSEQELELRNTSKKLYSTKKIY